MNKICKLINDIQNEINIVENENRRVNERNLDLFKILATVKNDLEKTLKKPETLHNTVYNCIDLLRANTPYYSTNEGRTKFDPPLTENEKNLG